MSSLVSLALAEHFRSGQDFMHEACLAKGSMRDRKSVV